MKNRDIIVVGLQAWDTDIGSNCKNIAEEFSRHNRVLYVNAPLDRMSFIKSRNEDWVIKRKKILDGQEPDLVTINPNMWNLYPRTVIESVGQVKPDFLFNLINKSNNKKFAATIKTAIKKLGFKDFIIFNDSDMYRSFYLKEFLKPSMYIYYSRDYLIKVNYWLKHGERMQSALLKKTDLVVSNSTYLRDYTAQFNSNSHYVGQGCDLRLFDRSIGYSIPDDLISIKNNAKPIVGFTGAINSIRLDIELLEHISETLADYNIVLVGPEDEVYEKSILHQKKNVFFLGKKRPNELARYVSYFDVTINPQVISLGTIGNYPRKIDEYLAMGKPVVAMKTDAMSVFEDYTYLASGKEEFTSLIRKAFMENSDQKEQSREAFAKTHTWENSVNAIYQAIEETKVTNP